MIPILLTATVNPNGMQGANFSVDERAKMYRSAVEFYVQKGMHVVFAENSGNISSVSKFFDGNENIEWVDVSGNGYDQKRGKGYNETILIHEAIRKSKMIQESGCFFKITGRLKLLNVDRMLNEIADGMLFKADCKDHRIYELLHMPINGHAGECRYWFATNEFFEQRMWPKLEQMNDYSDPPILAEDVMLQVCRETRGMTGCKDRFCTQARISGKGGHSLGNGSSFFYSTDNDSLALRTKCGIRQMLRWMMPWWRA